MKSILIILLALCSYTVDAQVVREGNTFKSVNVRSFTKGDTLVTPFLFEDSRGDKYPIIISKNTGSCYVWRKSKKKGKMYRDYMKPEVSAEISKELGIEYKPKERK